MNQITAYIYRIFRKELSIWKVHLFSKIHRDLIIIGYADQNLLTFNPEEVYLQALNF